MVRLSARATPWLGACLWAGTAVGCGSDCPPASPAMARQPMVGSPTAILSAVATRYRTCDTYRDTGEVVVTHTEEGKATTMRGRFATTFARGYGFRFEFQFVTGGRGQPSRLELVQNQHNVFLLAPRGTWVKAESLPLGLAAYTGISYGASAVTPGLLFSDFDVNPSSYLSSCTEQLADREVEGDDCFQFVCRDGESRTTFLIRKADLALRTLEELDDHTGKEKFRGNPEDHALQPLPMPSSRGMHRTTIFRPTINGVVSRSELDVPDDVHAAISAAP